MSAEKEIQQGDKDSHTSPAFEATLHEFRKSLPLRLMLQQLLKFLGNTHGHICLDIGVTNGVVSHHLRKKGGNWTSVAVDSVSEASLKSVLEEGNVHRLTEEGKFPFKDKSHDIIVVVNMLGSVDSDMDFVEDCHRILKNDGRLILCTKHRKTMSFINLLRSLLGLVPDMLSDSRKTGYTEAELFNILKNGFDVYSVRSYSRFFVQFVDAIVTALVKKKVNDLASPSRQRVYNLAAPFYWLAHQLDMLLFLSKGHCLVAEAKRRGWKDRNPPVLIDGRSITEAVLSPMK